MIEEYRDRRGAALIKPNTIVRELREWRAMLKMAVPEFKLPTKGVFPPEDLLRVKMLTDAEYGTIFPYLATHHNPILADLAELALLAVLRRSDVRVLQRHQVHLTERLLLLPRTKAGPRAVRLSDAAVTLLRRAMARDPRHDFVFANPKTGRPYAAVYISDVWHKAAKAVGLVDFHFHDLRHHGPTVAVNQGATVPVLMHMGGWKSAATVQRYASVLDPTLDKFLNQLRPPQPGDSPR